MTTTLSFKKGKVLLREAPYAAAICEVSLASSCSYCFKDANVKACSKCRTVSYCSKECRKKDSADHKIECIAIRRTEGQSLDTETRLVIRAISKHHREIQRGVLSVGDWFGVKRTIINLVSHIDYLANQTDLFRGTSTKAQNILKIIGDLIPCFHEELIGMIQRIRLNSYGSQNVVAVHLAASKFDHSCQPELPITHVFDGRKITFRALEDFTCERDQMRISYLPPLLSYPVRQDLLMTRYYFECDCNKCWQDYYDEAKEECEPSLSEEIEAVIALESSSEILEKGKELLSRMEHLPPENYWMYQLRCAMQSAAFTEEQYYDSLQHGYHAYMGTDVASYQAKVLYTMYLALRELGWNNEDHEHHKYYLECLRKGGSLFEVCFGKKHPISSELRKAQKMISRE
ncbi:N-lysine methyltransferase SMYD2-A-like [Varroa jacobsoni]|uniref:N-lysine methyltransferase SMYD2-A-like n=1 Tax=Varroa jacobsoni TaxID=62625 RepID=UPI000BF8A4AC|nr:N-lysine methyltransferase SMYD2-A-like [Varroa jacobsoni]